MDRVKNGLAGGSSAALCVTIFNPLDTLKVRWQMLPAGEQARMGNSPRTMFLNIVRNASADPREGLLRGLWTPGVLANGCSILISTSVRMGLYPIFRDFAVEQTGRRSSSSGGGSKNAGHMFFSGLVPGGIGYWLGTPLYQVKNRLQAEAGSLGRATAGEVSSASAARLYTGTFDCLTRIVREEGASALFRGATPMVFRGAGVTGGQFLGYDGWKTYVGPALGMQEGPLLHLCASVAAAFWATTCCTPFDFVMTRYQNSAAPGSGGQQRYRNVFDCARQLTRDEGLAVLYRGWTPLFTRLAIVMSTYMPLYEQLRAKVLRMGYFH